MKIAQGVVGAAAGVFLCLMPVPAAAATLNGAALGLGWGLPFVGLLLTIAIGQAAFPALWERHYDKVSLIWIGVTAVPLFLLQGTEVAGHAMADLMVLQYVPFMVVMVALYVITAGIRIRTRMSGHPLENTILLAVGTVAGGFLGTPGATLLLLPVLLSANGWRRHKVHTMVFMIYLVANMGGGLTPLGPPLLIGYINGVHFLWTVVHMAVPTLMCAALLLGAYYLLDRFVFYPGEDEGARVAHRAENDSFRVTGMTNIVLMILAVVVIVACGAWTSPVRLPLGPLALPLPGVVRVVALVALSVVSLLFTPRAARQANQFSWGPMREVVVVFAAIFVTMLPPLAILRAGSHGALREVIASVTAANGTPINWAYFVVSGALSSFLDNTPTFLVFFNAAGGHAATLMGPKETTLTAISAGAAFWGANTYIGNAPNFMVRSMALERGVAMPNFFRFMIWSVFILLPVFGLLAMALFGGPDWMAAGVVAAAAAFAILVTVTRRARRSAYGGAAHSSVDISAP